MSYTPNTWANGDVITAAKLNHIETGIQESSVYDGEISITSTYNGNTTGSIIKGDYTNLATMINNNIAPHILVHLWAETSTYGYTKGTTTAVAIYSTNFDASEPAITFMARIYSAGGSGTYSSDWYGITFTWLSDNTIYL